MNKLVGKAPDSKGRLLWLKKADMLDFKYDEDTYHLSTVTTRLPLPFATLTTRI